MKLRSYTLALSIVACSLTHAQIPTANIRWLGVLPGGTFSKANAVSNNGRVVGYGDTSPVVPPKWCQPQDERERIGLHAFYWNGTSLININPAGPDSAYGSIANDITGDGLLIVGSAGTVVCNGYIQDFGYAHAWVLNTSGIQANRLDTNWSVANSVSYLPYNSAPNGRRIVGTRGVVHSGVNRGRPGYYDLNSGFYPLPLLPRPDGGEWNWGSANGVSGDGAVAVGVSHYVDDEVYLWYLTRPTCWKEGNIYMLEGGLSEIPLAASGNGSVIAGSGGEGPVIWLGCPGQRIVLQRGLGAARDIDARGRVVVGNLNGRAYRWIAGAIGMGEDLNTTFSYLLRDGSVLYEARGISPNGRFIVGVGWNSATGRAEAYLLDTGLVVIPADVNLDGCVDDGDLISVLYALGDSGWLREDVNADFIVDDDDLLEVITSLGACGE